MPLYLAIHSQSGVMHRLNTSLNNITPLGTDEAVLVLDAYDVEPDPTALRYDAMTRAYVPVPAPVSDTTCTVLQFKSRFTADERIVVDRAQHEHADLAVRAQLRVIEKDMADAQDKRLNRADPRLQAGVGYLAVVGLIPAARVTDIIGADALGA